MTKRSFVYPVKYHISVEAKNQLIYYYNSLIDALEANPENESSYCDGYRDAISEVIETFDVLLEKFGIEE